VAVLFELDADPEVMRYITGGKAPSRAEVEATVHATLGHRWVAFGGDRCVGWFERQLGDRLRRDAWGRGFATEGARALVELAFRDFGVLRVWAQTMAVNQRSRRVLERFGLRYVRTFHLEWPEPIEGTELGEVEYELTRAEWLASRPWSSG
jgi:Acetyltransferase (GNAT) domain